MRHASLCSGIGASELAAIWMGWNNVFGVEIDSFCRKVLTKHFPTLRLHEDVKSFDGSEYADTIDVLTAGYPCQPFSSLGSRKAYDDPRHLFPHVLRVVERVRPRWCVFENVLGHVSLGLDDVLASMEGAGYACWPVVLEALSFGAAHHRGRVFIVARRETVTDPHGKPRDEGREATSRPAHSQTGRPASHPLQLWQGQAPPLSGCHGIPHGLPDGLDRHHKQRLTALGNAIVPAVMYHVFRAVQAAEALPNTSPASSCSAPSPSSYSSARLP